MSTVTPSLNITQVSVTNSQVSQVDFKMKANSVKTKLKSLLKKVDAEKSGFVAYDVFFPMLELHKVELTAKAIAWLKKNHSKNQTINFKDAINALTIDMQAAGQEVGELKWTVV